MPQRIYSYHSQSLNFINAVTLVTAVCILQCAFAMALGHLANSGINLLGMTFVNVPIATGSSEKSCQTRNLRHSEASGKRAPVQLKNISFLKN